MPERRPLGIKLIAAFFILKSTALIVAFIIANTNPELRVGAQHFIAQLAPSLQRFGTSLGMTLVPMFAILGIVIGMGTWFLKPWAWVILMVDCGIPLIRLVQVVVVMLAVDRKLLTLLPSSPYFAIDVISSILIVRYLLDSDVKRAFGDSE